MELLIDIIIGVSLGGAWITLFLNIVPKASFPARILACLICGLLTQGMFKVMDNAAKERYGCKIEQEIK